MNTLISILILGSIQLLPSNGEQALKVRIAKVDKVGGVVRVALFSNEDHYLNKAFRSVNVNVDQTEIEVAFENVPAGRYAISVYHDTNSNGVLDSNLLRIPKEPYGFSNNPSTRFGPPNFDEASFIHNSDGKTVTIKLK